MYLTKAWIKMKFMHSWKAKRLQTKALSKREAWSWGALAFQRHLKRLWRTLATQHRHCDSSPRADTTDQRRHFPVIIPTHPRASVSTQNRVSNFQSGEVLIEWRMITTDDTNALRCTTTKQTEIAFEILIELHVQVTHTLLRSVFRVLCFCYAKDCPG